MNTNIKSELVSTLERLATAQYQTPEEYASGFINAHLASQKRDDLIKTLDSSPVFEEVIVAKKEEIKQIQINEKIAYDLANPVIEKLEIPIIIDEATSPDKVIK
jgi:hypothetical protein